MTAGDQRSPRPSLRVDVVDAAGRPRSAGGLGRWLSGVAPRSAVGAVTIALVADGRVRRLNRLYRRCDYATDVLSFPAQDASSRRGGSLGDVVIATGVARRQARRAGHRDTIELRVLALHGLLHLLGYDHEDDDGRMARVEARLRRKGGLSGGLIERTAGSRDAAGRRR